MELFERLLSSPKDYPLPPLVIKDVKRTYYHQKPRRKSFRMVFHLENPKDKYIRKHQINADDTGTSLKTKPSQKSEYIKVPTLRKPTLAAIGFIKVSPHLLGLYKRAEEKQKAREASRIRRFPVRKKKSRSKTQTPVIEIVEEIIPIQVEEPLVRFRRAVKTVQVLLKATLTSNTPGQRNESLLSWAHDDVSTSKREYEMFGLSFDPGDFRAKKEALLSNEAKVILSMDPERRTEEQLKVSLLALNQAVEAFSEFPITMQRSLVRVGWYEHFEDKRVIIRQGHMADNFYFILSGTAVVTILQRDSESGEQVVRTAAVLKKGNSFGELALMHGAKRSATVTCKNSVELLAVGREDFVDIFMPMDKDQEPEHIRFLRSILLLKGWPIEKLPYHDPKICCFTYFRRGLLLCKDSNSSEWVYIIKTGTCRVLKALHTTRPQIPGLAMTKAKSKNLLKLPPISPSYKSSQSQLSSSSSSECSPRSGVMHELIPSRRRCTVESLSNILHKPYPFDEVLTIDHQKKLEEVYTEKHTYTTRWGKRLSPKVLTSEVSHKGRKPETVYVQIQKLGPKETYGVEQVAFGRIGQTTSTILVSEGAECILINRKYFQQYLSDEEAKKIRRTLQPIPTDESLQQKLQDKTNWEAYKAVTVVNHMINRKSFYSDDTSYY